MSSSHIFSDWKKLASQISSRNTNKDQQEQAFMNLAYGYVSQKAGKLMEDPHRLGFEIVYSNDDGSKQAGMFAFRVGRTLISVPAIYINNEVKATELMYEHDTKLVRPLSVDWTDYIISKYHAPEARPEDPSVTGKMTSGMQLDRLANPRMYKQSSAWEDVFADLEAKSEALPDILQEFLIDAGESSMQKLARAMDDSLDFAQALTGLDESIYLPELLVKEAEAQTPDLELYFRHFPLTKISKEENDQAHKRGWMLIDNRDDLKPITRATEELLSEVAEPGLYDIVTAGGGSERAWVLNKGNLYNSDSGFGNSARSSGALCSNPGSQDRILVWESDKVQCSCHGTLWGAQATGENGNTWRWQDAELPETPVAGKTYYALQKDGGNAFGPYKIKSISKRPDDVHVLTIADKYSDDDTETAFINPDFQGVDISGHRVQVFGGDMRWLEVKSEARKHGGYSLKHSDTKAGGKEDLLSFFSGAGLKKVTMDKETEGPGFRISENDEPVFDDIDGVDATVKAASVYGISASDAMLMYDEVRAHGSISVYVDQGLEKRAAQAQGTSMQIINSPNHQMGYNDEQRTLQDSTQSWTLDTATGQPTPPVRRLGDAHDPTMGTSPGNQDLARYISEEGQKAGVTDADIFDNSPEDIAAMYTESNIPNLFQHGTVGMLVSTYDSASMINKYIPKLEEGLDHFGRILFLFYWKPQDFEKLYGADDLSNLEQELLSQFKSFGDVLLQLIKKNDTRTGSVPTP